MATTAEDGRPVSSAKAAATLNERHPEWQLARKALAKARNEGSLRGKTVDELETELAELACHEDGCERRAVRESGYCFLHVRGASSRDKPRPQEVSDAISRTKRENPWKATLEQRSKMAGKKRKKPGQRVYDKLTGEQIVPRRPGLADVPLEELRKHDLDLFPASRIERGEGKYVSQRNKALHQLETKPRHTQGEKGTFGIPDQGKLVERACWLCRRPVWRYESQVEAAERDDRRFVCAPSDRRDNCSDVWNPAHKRAARAIEVIQGEGETVRGYRIVHGENLTLVVPPAGSSDAMTEALQQLLRVARDFEVELRNVIPRRRGNPRRYDVLLIVEALHVWGDFSGEVVDTLLGFSSGYSKELRNGAGIRRRGRVKDGERRSPRVPAKPLRRFGS